LLEREGTEYTVGKIAAKTGKASAHIAKRLRLSDLISPVADARTAGLSRKDRVSDCPG
jgi:hypothetical protein